MQQQAAACAAVSSAPLPESGQASGEALKCDQCDFVSKSKRGLKTYTSRAHKVDDAEVVREPEECSASPTASSILDTSREEVREEKELTLSSLRAEYDPRPRSSPTYPPKIPCLECFANDPCPI